MATMRFLFVCLVVTASAQDVFLTKEAAFSPPHRQPPWTPQDTNALDEYVSKPDPNFKWRDTGGRVKMLSGATAHILNVTSQQWLDDSRAVGPNGAIWSHQLTVVVPTKHTKKKGIIYITGGCNENPGLPSATDEEPLSVDLLAAETGAIGVVLNQIPNCHIVYPSDPARKPREEDAMLAWAWKEYIDTQEPEWLPWFAMVKGAMAAMTAVQEYTSQSGLGEIDGWLVSGASKRGWTTWLTGAVNCPTCPKIDAIAPIVPIVPNLRQSLHHMYQSYGGWTFAFADYLEANGLTQYVDDSKFISSLDLIDPINYVDRLAKLPKFVLVSSDDEFMMMEWTRLWWDKLTGEKHLMIANNAEHSMATGIIELLQSLGVYAKSVFENGTRPSFDWTMDLEKGSITVNIPQGVDHGKVVLRHAHTTTLKRRDFRWVAKPDAKNGTACTLPNLGPIAVHAEGLEIGCVQPVVWTGITLNASSPGVYTAPIPKPSLKWTGAYVEVFFPSDTGMKQEYQFTTAGMVWPQTFPYSDCHGKACLGHLV